MSDERSLRTTGRVGWPTAQAPVWPRRSTALARNCRLVAKGSHLAIRMDPLVAVATVLAPPVVCCSSE